MGSAAVRSESSQRPLVGVSSWPFLRRARGQGLKPGSPGVHRAAETGNSHPFLTTQAVVLSRKRFCPPGFCTLPWGSYGRRGLSYSKKTVKFVSKRRWPLPLACGLGSWECTCQEETVHSLGTCCSTGPGPAVGRFPVPKAERAVSRCQWAGRM